MRHVSLVCVCDKITCFLSVLQIRGSLNRSSLGEPSCQHQKSIYNRIAYIVDYHIQLHLTSLHCCYSLEPEPLNPKPLRAEGPRLLRKPQTSKPLVSEALNP